MSIKVLLTGYTAQHIGSTRTHVKYGAVTDMYADILRLGGCEVDHRRVLPNEDLTGYDLLLCGQVSPATLGASYLYGALDAIGRAKKSNVGLMFFLDDWQTHNIVSGLKTFHKVPTRVVRDSAVGCRKNHDWATANIDRIYPVIDALNTRPWPATIVPKFSWGTGLSVVKGLNSREWIWADVSAFAQDYNTSIPDDSDRERAWVLGTLSDQTKWLDKLGLNWNVHYIGTKRTKAEKVLSEVELCDVYANSWGVLAAKYPHAGSGWWRNRFIHAVRTRSILLADPLEVSELGESYLKNPSEIESMTTSQLRELADAQRDVFYSKETPKEQVIDTIMNAVHRAIAEARQ